MLKLRSAGILKTDLERGSVDEKARSSGRQININVQLLWAFEEARLDRSGYGGEVGVDKADQYKAREDSGDTLLVLELSGNSSNRLMIACLFLFIVKVVQVHVKPALSVQLRTKKHLRSRREDGVCKYFVSRHRV